MVFFFGNLDFGSSPKVGEVKSWGFAQSARWNHMGLSGNGGYGKNSTGKMVMSLVQTHPYYAFIMATQSGVSRVRTAGG